jgi:hypothetical protein
MAEAVGEPEPPSQPRDMTAITKANGAGTAPASLVHTLACIA